jgi:hypothetical protein
MVAARTLGGTAQSAVGTAGFATNKWLYWFIRAAAIAGLRITLGGITGCSLPNRHGGRSKRTAVGGTAEASRRDRQSVITDAQPAVVSETLRQGSRSALLGTLVLVAVAGLIAGRRLQLPHNRTTSSSHAGTKTNSQSR